MTLKALQGHEQQRDRAARAWKAAGGKVVGYICETVPRELITAAGFLAYRMSGDPLIGQGAQERYVHTLAPKGFSNARNNDLEYVNAICSMVLEGHYDFVDYLVISNTRKLILLMQSQLRDAAIAFPELKIPELYVLDRAQTRSLSSVMFNRDRVLAFRGQLETWAGKPITSTALKAALTQGNETRALLRRTRELRAARKLSAVDALAIYAAANLMPPGDFNPLAEAALAPAEGAAPRAGKRVFVSGSPLDHGQFYGLLEAAGASVVGDDQAWGDRLAEPDIALRPDPLEAMITHYEEAQPLLLPLARSVARTVDLAKASGAVGAVINVIRNDDIKLWEAPDEIAALEAAGIAVLHLKDQPYRITDGLSAETAAFIESLPEGAA